MRYLTPARVTFLMLAVVATLVGAYVAKKLFAADEPVAEVRTRNVPMAIADIEPGTEITEAHLGLGPIREENLAPDILLNNRVIVGRVAKVRIPRATPIQASQLFAPGERPPLAVSPGHRAVSVRLGDSPAVLDGLVRPGQFVDVHLTPSQGGNDERLRGGMTLTLFRGVKVLALNRSSRSGASQRRVNSVTLELTPRQANVLILAQSRGDITLTYNPEGAGSGDVAAENEDRAFLEEILGLEPLPQPPQPFVTETYRGSRRDELRFRDGKRVDERGYSRSTSRPSGNGNSTNARGQTPADNDAAGKTGDEADGVPQPADETSAPTA